MSEQRQKTSADPQIGSQNDEQLQSREFAEGAFRLYADLYDFSPASYFTLAQDGTVLKANQAGTDLLGVDYEELVNQRLELFIPVGSRQDFNDFLGILSSGKGKKYIELPFLKNRQSHIWGQMEATCFEGGPETRVVIMDITRSRHTEMILQTQLDLSQYADSHSLDELLQKTLDAVEALTNSQIGFAHFLEEDQQTLHLQTWSTNTLKNMCTAEGKNSHYPVDQAGVWVEAVHTRTPVIHNDYPGLPASLRKGMPQGHAPVQRELVVPILRNGLIMMIMGVGNKPTDYTDQDIEILSKIAGLSWDVIQRKRVQESLRESEQRFQSAFEFAAIGMALVSPAGLFVKVNQALCDLLDYSPQELTALTFQDITHPDDLEVDLEYVRQMLAGEISTYQMEKRYIGSHHNVIWILLSVSLIRDTQNQPLYFISQIQNINSRKQVEKVLQEFANFPVLNPGPVLRIDSAGLIKLANPVASSLGLVVGTYINSFISELNSASLVDCINTGSTNNYEMAINDRFFAMTLRGAPQMDQAFIFGVDITRRKLAEKLLQDSELFVKNILNSLTAHIAVLDSDGAIIAVNEGWNKFARENDSPDPAAYLGTNYLAACRAAAQAGDLTALQIAQNISALLDGSLAEFSTEYPCNSPTQERWFTVTGVPQHGSRKGAILIHQDITDLKRAELELQQSQLQEAKAEIDRQLKRFQTEVTQNISHELRTPMTQIMLTLNLVLLEKFGDSEDLNWFVESALSQTHRLNIIVDSLIFLSDLDAGNMPVISEVIDPVLNFGFPIKKLTEQYKDKALKIEIRIAKDLAINAPITAFTLACTHLVDNSLKFSPPKGSVLIDLASNGIGGCILTITDHGPGIPKELQEKVFERYFQVSQGLTREYGGLGVGLTIARIVARSLGGDVTILPAPRGSRVQMVIPPAPLDK